MNQGIRKLFIITLFSAFIFISQKSLAADFYVDPAGSDANSCLAPLNSACLSIQRAIDLAASGDTVHVAPGDYSISSSINFNGKNLSLLGSGVRGANMTRIIAATGVSAFVFVSNETGNASVRSFLVQASGTSAFIIGDVNLSLGTALTTSSPTIEGNVIIGSNLRNNSAVVAQSQSGVPLPAPRVRNNLILDSFNGIVATVVTEVTNNTVINSGSEMRANNITFSISGGASYLRGNRINNLAYASANGFRTCSSGQVTYSASWRSSLNQSNNFMDTCLQGAGNIQADPRIVHEVIAPSEEISVSSLRVTGAEWAPNQWKGYFVAPNLNSSGYPVYFLILSNTADTLTVANPNNHRLDYAARAGDYFGITDFHVGRNSPIADNGNAAYFTTGLTTDLYGNQRTTRTPGAVAGDASRDGPHPQAAVLYLSPSGTDSNPNRLQECTNPLEPCKSPAYAFAAAYEGDTLRLSAGDYPVSGTIGFGGRNIVVEGAGVRGNQATRIVSSAPGAAFAMSHDESNATAVRNLVIAARDEYAFELISAPIIENNVILGRRSGIYAGASDTSPAIFRNNLIVSPSDTGIFTGYGNIVNNNTVVGARYAAYRGPRERRDNGGRYSHNIAYDSDRGFMDCADGNPLEHNNVFETAVEAFGSNCHSETSQTSDPAYPRYVPGQWDSVTATTLTDGQAQWIPNEWKGFFARLNVIVTEDETPAEYYYIESNTENTLTLTAFNDLTQVEFSSQDYFITDFTPGMGTSILDMPATMATPISDVYGIGRLDPAVSDIGAVELIAQPEVLVDDVQITEAASDGALIYTVSLAFPYEQVISVGYSTRNGTAVAGNDFEGKSGVLRFEPGETSKQLEVRILEDTLDEEDETFEVVFTNRLNAYFTDNAVREGMIIDDDVIQPLAQSGGEPAAWSALRMYGGACSLNAGGPPPPTVVGTIALLIFQLICCYGLGRRVKTRSRPS